MRYPTLGPSKTATEFGTAASAAEAANEKMTEVKIAVDRMTHSRREVI
jgi:hypothetical protein